MTPTEKGYWNGYYTAIFAILMSVLIFSLFGVKSASGKTITCIDGDTFKINNTYYRLAYIDTPEKEEPGYKAASVYTCDYLTTTNFTLKKHGKDIYKRTLVEVVARDSKASLNEWLIIDGKSEPFWGKTTNKIMKLYYDAKDI